MTATLSPPPVHARGADARIPMARLVRVEIRKMFDTRAGLWLMISIGILALLATVGVILFANDDVKTYSTFAAAIGFPMGVVLPIIAILSVTSEWSQRTGLVTFALEPRRERVLLAKAIGVVLIAVVSIVIAALIGALGNVVGASLAGIDLTWDFGLVDALLVLLGQILGLMLGFGLGVLIRSSAGAIVAYFVVTFVITSITSILAAFQDWFAELQPWIDFNFATTPLFSGDGVTGEQWAQLAVSGSIWLVLPLAIGTWRIMKAEIK
ncbi:MAG: ABC transporter permease subunit [Geodermatophilaceae bacterium]|nr:ABC transporter permease subunit [Geodermatophilaceae bacterium]